MRNDDNIRDEKLQYNTYNINREAAKTSTLSSGKIDMVKKCYLLTKEGW